MGRRNRDHSLLYILFQLANITITPTYPPKKIPQLFVIKQKIPIFAPFKNYLFTLDFEKMGITSESGHAKNVSNLDEIISACTSYGATYNPSKATIKLAGLQASATSAKAAMAAVNTSLATLSNATAARQVAFEPLNKLITRVINALKATDSSDQIDDSAKSIARKIQGARASVKLTDEEKKTLTAEGKEAKQISSSQMSFDMRLDNLDKLIKLLASIPAYAPNEVDLKVATLTALYADLKAKNQACVTAHTQLSSARIVRNDVLYKANTGVVDSALDVKTYVGSVYGTSAPQYKQISKLEFRPL